MNTFTAFDTGSKLPICKISGNITRFSDGVEVSLYPDNYVFFSGDKRRGWKLSDDLISLEAKEDVPYTANTLSITTSGTASISGLPSGAIMSVLGETETESNGLLTFQSDLAGTYELVLTHPLHLDTTITVIVT